VFLISLLLAIKTQKIKAIFIYIMLGVAGLIILLCLGDGVDKQINMNSEKLLFLLLLFFPSLAIAIRRLHDANLSGWFYLLICFFKSFNFNALNNNIRCDIKFYI
jgi:uncharacterized membrane protein YhaH (DUF805 family)